MKTLKLLGVLTLTSLTMSSCLTTLLTIASTPEPSQPATAVVIAQAKPQPQPTVVVATPTVTTTQVRPAHGAKTTTVVQVNAATRDLCLYLDLQAVGAAFAQSSSVQEFEMILNSNRYMISNLDLNGDGFVDYLRVMEVISGYNHVFVLQAVLAPNVFQNVATITVEMGYTTPYCQIIGEPYIYGTAYIVQPVFVKRPPLFDPFMRPGYEPWQSPYYWNHFPSHYAKPAPQQLGHYQAYVKTYVSNNKYCREVSYPTQAHYSSYESVRHPVSRNDYQTSHPEQAFSSRTSAITYKSADNGSSRSVRNAADVRRAADESITTTTKSSSRSASTNAQTTTRSTTTQSRVNSSGTVRTTTRSSDPTNTTSTSSSRSTTSENRSSTRSNSTSTRSNSTSTSSRSSR